MAREYSKISLDMLGDADWRALSMPAQWLYKLLLTHPQTNRAGVCDWRPKRLAVMASGLTAHDIEQAGAELAAGHFIAVDPDTEEVVIRSFVKHDGVMKQPNMAVTMANDWTGVASELIRGVVAFEVQKLKREQPGLPGWKSERQLETILSASGVDVKNDPSVHPSVDPSVKGESMGHATETETITKTSTPLQVEGGTPAAPSPFCSRHPEGTDQPCRGCKVAWGKYETWAADGAPPVHQHRWLADGSCLGCTEMQEDF